MIDQYTLPCVSRYYLDFPHTLVLDAEIIETDCVEEFKQKLAPFM